MLIKLILINLTFIFIILTPPLQNPGSAPEISCEHCVFIQQGSTLCWQYPVAKSRVKKEQEPIRTPRVLSVLGSGLSLAL